MIYAFGEYELDTRVYELRRAGSVRPVEPQVFDVLVYLARNRERVVSKEELLDQLWPDRFVSETTLTSRLKEARKAVGDDGTKQAVIRTQRGRGYRFVAAAEERGDLTESGLTVSKPEAEKTPREEASGADVVSIIEGLVQTSPRERAGFVGRQDEIGRLTALLRRALEGKRKIAFVTGEGGVGKTTLVDTFLSDLPAGSPILIARGQCVEYRGSGEPYMPLLDAFTRLSRGPGGERVAALLRREAPSWLVQMPSLLSAEELAALRESIGESGERMVRELGMLIDRLTIDHPLILVLEDLHWSDYATLDAIDLLARQAETARLLVIGTWRPSDVKAARHPVYALSQELRVKGQCEVIPLPLFGIEELRRYLESKFGGARFIGDLAPLLQARTAGNALFVRNLVDSWIERGLIREIDEAWELGVDLTELEGDVPDSLQRLIENQIEELDPDQQRTLEAASVAGRSFAIALVAAALPAADDDLERECDRLVRESNILKGAGAEQWGDGSLTSRFSFVHDLYVDVLYEGIPAVRRSRLHQQIGLALERAWNGREREHAPELALHFQRALDRPRGSKYLQLAAEQALERNAYREAVDHLSAAIELLEGTAESTERRQVELQVRCRLAPSLVATRGWADSGAEENYLRARELAEDLGETALLMQTLYGLANMYEYRGEYELAERITRERIALDTERVPGQILESHELLTCTLLHQGRYQESVHHGEQALSAHIGVDASELDPEELVLVVQAHGWMSGSLHFAGRTDEALLHSSEALRLAAESGNALAKASANIQAAFLRFYRREAELCHDLAETGGMISRELRFPFHVACSRVLKGWAMVELGGDCEEAIREIRAGTRTSEAIGARMDLPVFHAILAEVQLRAGDIDAAHKAILRGIELVSRGRTFFYAPELHRQLGRALIDLGRPEEGLDSLRRAFEMAEEQGCTLFALRAAKDLATFGDRSWKDRLRAIYHRFSQGSGTRDLQDVSEFLD